MSLGPVLPALAAGNCVLIKPSEISAATSAVMAEIVPRYLDPDCVTVVQGGVPETTALLNQRFAVVKFAQHFRQQHCRFDYIFYTGSPAVGRIIGKAAAAQLTPCTLELGGKSPAYIDNSVDLEVINTNVWNGCRPAMPRHSRVIFCSFDRLQLSVCCGVSARMLVKFASPRTSFCAGIDSFSFRRFCLDLSFFQW